GSGGAGAPADTRPEIGIALKGPIDTPKRTIDVAALTSWLALRAVEQQSKKLDVLEGRAPVPPPVPAAVNATSTPTPKPVAPAARSLPPAPPANRHPSGAGAAGAARAAAAAGSGRHASRARSSAKTATRTAAAALALGNIVRVALVSRFRSSQSLAAHSPANFGIKGTLATYDSRVISGFEVPI